MRPFDELKAVVTGANRGDGIGLAIVHELVVRGATVVGTYRDPSNSAQLLDLARDDARVVAAPLDVTSDESVAAFAEWYTGKFGRLDLLINNAGVGEVPGDVLTAPLEELERQLQTHAIGMLRMSRALLPVMERGAVVMNISSTLASLASMSRIWPFYGPAKTLQNALTRQIADTVRQDGIIVFSVNPGWVKTSLSPPGRLKPAESAVDLVDLAAKATLEDAGTFQQHDGSSLRW